MKYQRYRYCLVNVVGTLEVLHLERQTLLGVGERWTIKDAKEVMYLGFSVGNTSDGIKRIPKYY